MEERSDIEEILAKAKSEERPRGKLKIFFGAAAGVGKTYKMLESARIQKKEGADVVFWKEWKYSRQRSLNIKMWTFANSISTRH
jgi:two-component system sensor histidine kinase KdpD